MNEYEGALFAAVMVLTKAIVEGVSDRAAIASRYREAAKDETEFRRKNGAATLEILARLTEADRLYTTRTPFSIIDGGKDDNS
jgi:hypothetical protein